MCNHEGENRGWIEIHRIDNGWAAHAFLPSKLLPEVIFMSEDDPQGALEGAALELGNAVCMIDDIEREEAE